jgi:hypothetical protein
MVRYAIAQMEGRASLMRLAGASAQREAAVRIGLRWLEQHGVIQITHLQDGELFLMPGTGKSTGHETMLFSQLSAILEETKAFRKYFQSAEKDSLL